MDIFKNVQKWKEAGESCEKIYCYWNAVNAKIIILSTTAYFFKSFLALFPVRKGTEKVRKNAEILLLRVEYYFVYSTNRIRYMVSFQNKRFFWLNVRTVKNAEKIPSHIE